MRFAFRHFPLTEIPPHALAASAAAETAHLQGLFGEMHELLFHRQKALEVADLRGYAAALGLDVERFDRERTGASVLARGAGAGVPMTLRSCLPPTGGLYRNRSASLG